MRETVTITHHVQKPEYHWEIVVPEQPTTLLAADKIETALQVLGVSDGEVRAQIMNLGDGESRSIDVEIAKGMEKDLAGLGKQKML